MKVEFDFADLKTIADMVAEQLRPMLQGVPSEGKSEDEIMDIPALCEYLDVKERWVRHQITLKGIPFFRLGNRIRFRKREIDHYIKVNRAA